MADLKIATDEKREFESTLKEVWREEQKSNYDLIVNLENRRTELKSKLNDLVVALASHPELEKEFKESIDKIKKEISDVEGYIQEAKNIEKDLVEFISFGITFADQLKKDWWKLSVEQREKCKQMLFPNDFFVNYNEKVYTSQISPIYRLAHTKKEPDFTSDSHLVELARIALASKKRFNIC